MLKDQNILKDKKKDKKSKEQKVVIKVALDMTKEQARILDGQSKIANWLYNHLLEEANGLRKEYATTQDKVIGKKLYSKFGLRNRVPSLKDKFSFLKSLYSSVSKNAALRLSNSIKQHQTSKKSKKKKTTGWPQYRSYNNKWFSLEYDEPWKGYRLDGNTLTLSLGKTVNSLGKEKQMHIDLLLRESIPNTFDSTRVLRLSIVKEHNVYYAVFFIRKQVPSSAKEIKNIVALDPNHKNLVYGVDNNGQAMEIQNYYLLKNIDKAIDALKSKRDRCKRKSVKITREEDGAEYYLPSKRYTFLTNKLQKLYQVRQDQTKVFLYTVANKLFKNYDHVGIGDYTPNGTGITTKMRRAMNNQSLIGRLKNTLEWVATKSGKSFREWNEKGTTRTCNKCDYKIAEGINPTIREWTCPKCQTHHLRDENAAINGLKRVFKKLKLPCSGRLEVASRRAWRFNGFCITTGNY